MFSIEQESDLIQQKYIHNEPIIQAVIFRKIQNPFYPSFNLPQASSHKLLNHKTITPQISTIILT